MNNADMPAMPQSVSRSDDGAVISSSDFVGCEGLTKREYFAGLAMQGLSTATSEDGTWQHEPHDCAIAAVEYADALLAELDKEKKQ